jgi:hypothetical protein
VFADLECDRVIGRVSSILSVLRRLIGGSSLVKFFCAAGARTADSGQLPEEIRQREEALAISKTKLALAAKLPTWGRGAEHQYECIRV